MNLFKTETYMREYEMELEIGQDQYVDWRRVQMKQKKQSAQYHSRLGKVWIGSCWAFYTAAGVEALHFIKT